MVIVQIYDEDHLLRRVPTYLPNYIKPDGTISSLAFSKKKDEDGLSVELKRLTNFETAIIDSMRFRLLSINVGIVLKDINDGLKVLHDPINLPENQAHCLITGNITESKKKQLLKCSIELHINWTEK